MISPSQARAAILQGLAQGWKPTVKGPQQVLPAQALYYDDQPTVSPGKSLGHALLHIACEHRRLAMSGLALPIPHVHFTAGSPPTFHLDWMLSPWSEGSKVKENWAATLSGQESWASIEAASWASLDRTQLFRAWANTLPRIPYVSMPHAQFLTLEPIAKKEWAQAMIKQNAARNGIGEGEKTIWNWADLLWERFPEIWQLKGVDGTAIHPILDPYSICVFEPQTNFIGILTYPQF
jgi:hypothetical protein